MAGRRLNELSACDIALGVATGAFTVGELAAAGAHAVLPDLADTDLVVAAILGTDAG